MGTHIRRSVRGYGGYGQCLHRAEGITWLAWVGGWVDSPPIRSIAVVPRLIGTTIPKRDVGKDLNYMFITDGYQIPTPCNTSKE
jgi:hypothetical protein